MQDILGILTVVSPTLVAFSSGLFGYFSVRAEKLNKKQFEELKTDIQGVQKIGNENRQVLAVVQEKVAIHDESHLATMYLRLEREIKHELARGYTDAKTFSLVERMHVNYKALGGNGYIDRLYDDYLKLDIKE